MFKSTSRFDLRLACDRAQNEPEGQAGRLVTLASNADRPRREVLERRERQAHELLSRLDRLTLRLQLLAEDNATGSDPLQQLNAPLQSLLSRFSSLAEDGAISPQTLGLFQQTVQRASAALERILQLLKDDHPSIATGMQQQLALTVDRITGGSAQHPYDPMNLLA
jgi:hypothetical protein